MKKRKYAAFPVPGARQATQTQLAEAGLFYALCFIANWLLCNLLLSVCRRQTEDVRFRESPSETRAQTQRRARGVPEESAYPFPVKSRVGCYDSFPRIRHINKKAPEHRSEKTITVYAF